MHACIHTHTPTHTHRARQPGRQTYFFHLLSVCVCALMLSHANPHPGLDVHQHPLRHRCALRAGPAGGVAGAAEAIRADEGQDRRLRMCEGMEIYGMSVGNVGEIYGISIEYQWNISGIMSTPDS